MVVFEKVDLEVAADFYRDQGYAVFNNLIDRETCDYVERLCRDHAMPDYRPLLNLDRALPQLRELVACEPDIVKIVESMMAAEMAYCQTTVIFKQPGTTYGLQEWNPHQDNSYAQTDKAAYATISIALADQSADSGGLYIYPESHRLGTLPFEPTTSGAVQSGNRILEVPVHLKRLNVALAKGQGILFDGDTIHGSEPNVTGCGRPVIVTNYVKKNAPLTAGRTANRIKMATKL